MNFAGFDVSRETFDRLKIFEALLKKWNPAINLVAKSTISEAWSRHFADSAQIHSLAQDTAKHWADLGSGGGFPGLVVAILAMERPEPLKVTLVESDARKCTFLQTVARETGATVTIVRARIEDCEPLAADVLSARALSDLCTLLTFSERHLSEPGEALFLKGATWQKEVEDAQRSWNFQHQAIKSRTENGSAVLRISGVSRV